MQAGKSVYGSFALYAVTGATDIERIPSSECAIADTAISVRPISSLAFAHEYLQFDGR